ncbi:hypothetical protein [Fretibacter rubidus]|uniref:hypothetical protein n=1 Tax=Fretibacter rubidus TaxID=570162 RepID=UPI00352A2A61
MTRSSEQAPIKQAGFVLPYVLVVIAILAMAGAIAATRLQNTTQTLASISAQNRTDRMIDNAERVATFALLAANPVLGGYDLNPDSPVQSEFGPMTLDGRRMDPRTAEAITPDMWQVNGGVRQVQTPDGPVIIVLQDVSGLPSLNTPLQAGLDQLLVQAGADPRQANQLVRRLADYVDADSIRRLNGAEATDYTLRRMAPPTNSPLRSYSELSQVMGWADVMPSLDMDMIKARTTIQSATDFREQFAPMRYIGPQGESLMDNNFDQMIGGVLRRDRTPTSNLRLSLYAQRTSGPDAGLWDKRVIEITKQTGHITHPHRRLWVLDSTVLETQTEFTAYGINPAQLSELKHVINPASLRP